jgi:hypothetical protein
VQAILLISNSKQEDKSTIAVVNQVLSEASTAYPQLSSVRSCPLPLPIAKLQAWSCWLGAEVIEQWRYQPATETSVDAVLAKLSLIQPENQDSYALLTALNSGSAGTTLTSELATQITSIRHRYRQQKLSHADLQRWLELEIAAISTWFTEQPKTASLPTGTLTCLMQVQANADALREKMQLHLQEVLVAMRQSGLQVTLQLFKALGERLTGLYQFYEARRQTSLQREGSAWRAFYNLNAQLQQHTFLSRRRKVDVDAVLQGLLKAYSFKLEAEICTQACQLVGAIKQELHVQSTAMVQANTFLAQIQDRFSQQSGGEPLFAPLLKGYLTQRIDLSRLRREIEGMVGCSITQWGKLRQNQEALVRQQILARLTPLCLEVYAQCYANLIGQNPEAQAEPAALQPAELPTDTKLLPGRSLVPKESRTVAKELPQNEWQHTTDLIDDLIEI